MIATHNPATPRQLSQAWRDWTEIVRLFAEKGSAGAQIRETVYGKIHQELTALLNGLVEQEQNGTDSRVSDLYDQLQALVQPWISLSALRDADQRISQNLLVQCQHCQSEIDAQVESAGDRVCRTEPASDGKLAIVRPHAQSQSAWGAVGVFALLFLGMFVVGLGSEFWSEIRHITSVSTLTNGLSSAWRGVAQDDDNVRFWSIAGVMTLVTGIAAWAVFRTPRSS